MEEKTKIALRTFWQSTRAKVAGAVALMVALFSGISAVNSAADNTISLFGRAEAAWSYLSTPWLGLACLVLLIFLVRSAVGEIKIAQEQKAAAESKRLYETQILIERETEVRGQAVKIVNLTAKAMGLRTDLNNLRQTVRDYEMRCERYERDLKKLSDTQKTYFPQYGDPLGPVEERLADGSVDLRFFSIQPPNWEPNWQTVQPIWSDAGGDKGAFFIPSENVAFLNAAGRNLTTAKHRIEALRKLEGGYAAQLEGIDRLCIDIANEPQQ